jgi:fumarate hydratase, class II
MTKRIEKDTMGEIEVHINKLWGAQTQRSLENFKIGSEKIPIQVVYALAIIKKGAARVNFKQGILDEEKCTLIEKAVDNILAGDLDEHFPLVVWQTGSGTQTNMNLNEVISNLANESVGGKRGQKEPIHPNDDCNKSQSSNDVFPSACSIAAVLRIHERLIPSLSYFIEALECRVKEFRGIVKIGRTHLMDATPLTLSDEFSAFSQMMKNSLEGIKKGLVHLRQLALGGTAVGTGLNTNKGFSKEVAKEISEITDVEFTSAPNKFEALSGIDAFVSMSAALRTMAVGCMKIANDIRLLSSGPRSGFSELILPANEPGSSIMPGKVNPTQSEALTQVAAQVIGNDATIAVCATHGHLQLNVFRPVVIYNLLQSVELLSDGVKNFTNKCLSGIKPNVKRIKEHLQNSLMLVTALNQKIGYENAAKIAKFAYENDLTLKQAALELKFLSEEEFDIIVVAEKMLGPDAS